MLPRENIKDLKCTICRKNKPEFEYIWGNVEEFLLCKSCAKMVARNVCKDILRKDPNFISELLEK